MINALIRFPFLSYIDIGNIHCEEQLSFQNDIEVNTLENERNLETVSSCQFAVNPHLPFGFVLVSKVFPSVNKVS